VWHSGTDPRVSSSRRSHHVAIAHKGGLLIDSRKSHLRTDMNIGETLRVPLEVAGGSRGSVAVSSISTNRGDGPRHQNLASVDRSPIFR
jgi:hypothetical protein